MYHTLIAQNVETWRHFRSNADYVPLLFSMDMQNHFLDMQKLFHISDYGLVKHIGLGTTIGHEDTHRVSGHPFEGQGHYVL